MKWSEMEKGLIEVKNRLSEYMRSREIGMAGIYRLLSYSKMYSKYEKNGGMENLKYDYMMSYDIRRNYQGKADLSKFLFDLKENRMSNLSLPLHWAIYKNRKK